MVFASTSEIDRMLALIDLRDPMGVRDHCILELARHTGLRVGELVGLDVSDVVSGGQGGTPLCVRTELYVRPAIAKGGFGRLIPLNAKARSILARQLDFQRRRGFSIAPSAPLFTSKAHRRLTTRAVQYVFADLRERAGLAAPVTPHSARHLFGTCLAQAGSLPVVQAVMGHRRLSSTQVYMHPSRAELAAAVERLVQ